MPNTGIVISEFGGLVPRHVKHQLAKTQAIVALDVKLANGILEPWKEPCVQTSVDSSAKCMYVRGNHLHTWTVNTQAAEISPDWGRFYITGRHEYPEAVSEDCKGNLTYQRLGIPTPTEAPSCEAEEACATDVDARSYCYTYVNLFGEESAPSPPSNIILVAEGTTVTVSGIQTPPSNYGIKQINIYRSASAIKEVDPKQQKFSSAFLLVAAISASATTFTDNHSLDSLGFPLDTEEVTPPPSKLSGIVAIDDLVRLAGFYENKIYFSENLELHNWPVKYELTLDDLIVHMEQSRQYLFVTTGSYPYVINTVSRDGCSPVIKSKAPYPDIACTYPHTHLMTEAGLIYVTLKGLALLGFDGQVKLLTTPWFDSTEWTKYQPDTARLGLYESYLFCTTDSISFILDLWGTSFTNTKGGELTFISDKPKDYFRSNTGDLYLLEGTKVKVWDKGTEYRKFYWESNNLSIKSPQAGRQLSLQPAATKPRSIAFAPVSAKVKSKSVKFSLVSSLNDSVYYTRDVSTEDWFRLPRIGRNNYYRVILQGTERVEFFSLGTSNFTVNDGV